VGGRRRREPVRSLARPGGYPDNRFGLALDARKPDFIPVGEHNAAIERILELRDATDVYISVVPRSQKRGTAASVRAVQCLWADIDSTESGTEADGFSLAPSLSVSSGTGDNRHNYYLLDERVEPEEAERLNRALARRLRSDERVADRARILRPPATFNHKRDSPSRTHLVACDREGAGGRGALGV
jgi:hypothetical protein